MRYAVVLIRHDRAEWASQLRHRLVKLGVSPEGCDAAVERVYREREEPTEIQEGNIYAMVGNR